jgi:hypothetical protein
MEAVFAPLTALSPLMGREFFKRFSDTVKNRFDCPNENNKTIRRRR